MGTKAERAQELFEQGYNCSQAVFGAFCEELGMDFETGIKLSSSFGGGMGRLREVCGAVSGMFLAAGLKYGCVSPDDDAAKAAHYQRIQKLAAQFREKRGTILCRELLGLEKGENDSYVPTKRSEGFYKTRPCGAIIGEAAEIFEKFPEEPIDHASFL